MNEDMEKYYEKLSAEELREQIKFEESYIVDYVLEIDVLRAEIAHKTHKLEKNMEYIKEARNDMVVMNRILEEKKEA